MLVADFFVQHQLTINDVYCTLKYGAIPVPGVSFRRWLTFHEPIMTEHQLDPRRVCRVRDPTRYSTASSRSRSWTRGGPRLEGKDPSTTCSSRSPGDFERRFRSPTFPRPRPRKLRAPDAFHPAAVAGSRKRFSGSQRSTIHEREDSSPPCGFGRRAKPINATFQGTTMKYCYQCGRMTAGEPLYCQLCGRTYDVKLCPDAM